MDMRLEVVPVPVRDIDAAKDFYTRQVGFGLDHDVRPNQAMRVVQMTPPGSACSVVIGEGLPLGQPGSVKGIQLVVEDLDAVRGELAGRGVGVSSWDLKARPARGTASSMTPTGTRGPSRNTSAPRTSSADMAPQCVMPPPCGWTVAASS
jgi:catechol 2,3-dioxygenase-like lactoylglutathione lyase family enzyme